MASNENQLEQNRRLRTWPFRKRHAILNGNTVEKIDYKINYDSELDLTRRDSLRSIFMTDSSKTIQVNERNISQNPTTTSINLR
jgi:hypothetical protein